MLMPRMRLCHFGDKFDKTQSKPSGSYLQLATNAPFKKQWNCQCKVAIPDHIIDWYGRGEEQTEWRKQISSKYATEVGDALHLKELCRTVCHAIQDDVTFSLPTTAGPGGGVPGNLNPSPGTADASTTTVGREARNKFNKTVGRIKGCTTETGAWYSSCQPQRRQLLYLRTPKSRQKNVWQR